MADGETEEAAQLEADIAFDDYISARLEWLMPIPEPDAGAGDPVRVPIDRDSEDLLYAEVAQATQGRRFESTVASELKVVADVADTAAWPEPGPNTEPAPNSIEPNVEERWLVPA